MSTTMLESPVRWSQEPDGVVLLTFDAPRRSTNVLNRGAVQALAAAIDKIEAEGEGISGVILISAKQTFITGGDIEEIATFGPGDEAVLYDYVTATKRHLRRLETLGIPVVAVLNGSALGGGLEVAMACHHRIAVASAEVALPEVTLGLLPGGGGLTRAVRMLGVENALDNLLLTGRRHSATAAKELGLIDEVSNTVDEALSMASAWIASGPEPVQPWDVKGYRIPGGTANDSPDVAVSMGRRAASLRAELKGVDLPAPRAILAAAVEGSLVSFEMALDIETRYFVELATGRVAKNLIKGQFLDLQKVNAGLGRPKGFDRFVATRIGVIGAGLMGAGIAVCCARAGAQVVLKDRSVELAETGRESAAEILHKLAQSGGIDAAEAAEILGRIVAVDQPGEFQDCEVVIEAVDEDPELKQRVLAEVEPFIAPDALVATNTSSLPITELAERVARADDFIGMHFFSPADKMPLVELVVGAATSQATVARAFDLSRQLRKTPIAVNDSRGFYTSRVMETFILEAVAMLGEGVSPLSIERVASQAGYPVPPLQLMDTLSLTLLHSVHSQTEQALAAAGAPYLPHPGGPVLEAFVKSCRGGRAVGGGFYDYKDGRRSGFWSEIASRYPESRSVPTPDIKDRMLFAQAIETARCLEENIVTSVEDANVGSMLGIGFPKWTGGTVQYANNYPGGLSAFVARAHELADRYGDRFRPPASLVSAAAEGTTYPCAQG